MRMDYTKCVEFVRKYASRSELHELMRPASKPYRYAKTTIHLTYFSMPDWLAILSAARWPQGSGEEPIRQVLRVMALESDIDAVLDFMKLDRMAPPERERAFRRLVLGYKIAANGHQDSIADCLRCFTSKDSGRALLMELGRTPHTITVMPHWLYFLTLPNQDFRSATTKGLRAGQILSHVIDGIPDNLRDSYAKGAPIPNLVGRGTGTGTGAGASVIIYYSVRTWTDTYFPDHTVGEAGFKPDDVLFHELVHATRRIRGKETSVTVEGRPNFGNIEEYLATVIANIYLSEKDARLVGAYTTSSTNPPKDWSVMKDPGGFYGNNDGLSMPPDRLMDTFQRTQLQFYHDLAHLPTPPWFNPVRIHFNRNRKIPV
jgi:hypothetical protein